MKENARVVDVMREIESQSGLTFFYSNEDVDGERRVTLKFKNAPIEKVLDKLFAGTAVAYKISERYIVLIKDDPPANPGSPDENQQPIVSGKIMSDAGEILPGVNIIEKGTTNGTVSDAEGNYSLKVSSPKALIVYSFIGFRNTETALLGRNRVDVVMKADFATLSEIVVIGYGTQLRKDITGSISSISGNEVSQLPVMNAVQGMQGKLSGVTITQASSPGGNTAMRIRGMGTIGDNEPLFIIDGVQTTDGLANFNPADIESIDVLKDASAAVYGSRSANGVVMVTTKRGSRRSSTKVDLSVYTGIQQRWKKVDVLNAREYVRVITESQGNANAQRAELGSAPLEPLPSDFSVDHVRSITHWQDEIFRPGVIQNYQLGISGGSERTNFMFSGSFRHEQGIIINSLHKRYTLRTSVDHDVSERISLGTTLNLSFIDRREIIENDIWNGVLQSAISMPEMFPVKGADNNYFSPPGGNTSIYGNAQNPVGQAERTDSKNPTIRVIGNVNGSLAVSRDIKFKTLLAFDLHSGTFKYYQPTFPEGPRPVTEATLYQSSTQSAWWNWENTLTYHKRIHQHGLSALAGMSAQQFGMESFESRSSGFPQGDYDALRYLRYGRAPSNDGVASSNALLSFFGRISYDYSEKYLFSATVRRDGSSRFFKNKWGTFSSFSAGWRISEEPFLKSSDVISNLKVRASFGQLGNQSVNSDFPWVTSMGRSNSFNTVLGGTLQPGVALVQWGNENLTWETTTMTDVGFDIGLLEDRLTLTIDYFNKRTNDMLLQVPLSLIAGQTEAPYVNAGAVENRGYEVSASYANTYGKFNFRVAANMSFIRNEVKDLAGVEYIIVNNTLRGSEDISRTAVGSSIGSFYGYVTDGIFKNQAEIDAHATQEPGTRPGDIRFKDISGPDGVPDGIINAHDRTIIGDGFPDFTYGMTLTARYGNFDASLFLQGVSGVNIFNALEYLTLNNQGGNKTAEILDYWSESNQDAAIPRLTWDDPNRNSRISDRYVHDGSYLRLKNIQVGYNFNLASLTKSISIQKLRVYLSVQNLFTLTGYDGFDPEVGIALRGYRSDLNLGVDQGRYPQPRIFLTGFMMTF
jgi:TonB-linked SusC/RagA family outer membrane protein